MSQRKSVLLLPQHFDGIYLFEEIQPPHNRSNNPCSLFPPELGYCQCHASPQTNQDNTKPADTHTMKHSAYLVSLAAFFCLLLGSINHMQAEEVTTRPSDEQQMIDDLREQREDDQDKIQDLVADTE